MSITAGFLQFNVTCDWLTTTVTPNYRVCSVVKASAVFLTKLVVQHAKISNEVSVSVFFQQYPALIVTIYK